MCRSAGIDAKTGRTMLNNLNFGQHNQMIMKLQQERDGKYNTAEVQTSWHLGGQVVFDIIIFFS